MVPQYLAALAIVLLMGTVLGRVLLLRRTGTRAMHFGKIDKTDFLIPPVALFYFYTVFAAAFGWPLVSAQRFFRSVAIAWVGVGICACGVLILVLSLWFFGWVGTLFLSSTRVIFAAAFDRVLPDRAAEVSERRRVPVYSLLLMLLPAVGLAALYAYNTDFHTYTLDATLVIAVTYLFSAIAVVILPWRKPDLWAASPASRLKLLGVPIVPAAGVVTIGLIGYCLYEWLSNNAYGVNNNDSLIYMGAMYVLAVVVYIAARVIRSRQGIDLSLINKEIPVE